MARVAMLVLVVAGRAEFLGGDWFGAFSELNNCHLYWRSGLISRDVRADGEW
jgi:hypothetical protein